MNHFLLNLLLAASWMLVNGAYSIADFLVGFLVGFASLGLTLPFTRRTSYFRRVRAAVGLVLFFVFELFASSVVVVRDILTLRHRSLPRIIHVPLDARTDLEIALLGNLLSLTPGSLSLDVTPDRQFLIVHGMFVDDPDTLIRTIKSGLERRLLEVTRE